MARVTVEDCLDRIPNRFDLVILASLRARGIYAGDSPRVFRDNDKNSVIALREIAENAISKEELMENAMRSFCPELKPFVDDDTYSKENLSKIAAFEGCARPESLINIDLNEDDDENETIEEENQE